MYLPRSENKGADQLRGYREADLRLCFRICKTLVFSRSGSIIIELGFLFEFLLSVYMVIFLTFTLRYRLQLNSHGSSNDVPTIYVWSKMKKKNIIFICKSSFYSRKMAFYTLLACERNGTVLTTCRSTTVKLGTGLYILH